MGDAAGAGEAASCAGWVRQCLQSKTRPPWTGAAVRVQKQADGSWSLTGAQCTRHGPPPITPTMVRDRVVKLVPGASLGLAPRGATLVNIQTVMWVKAPDGRDLPAFTLLGQQVAVHLDLDHVTWNFGDGHSVTVDHAGKAYDEANDPCRAVQCPDYFGHTYRATGPVQVRATAAWRASFTVNGGPAVPVPGTVSGPSATAPLTVKQARAVLVPNPGSR